MSKYAWVGLGAVVSTFFVPRLIDLLVFGGAAAVLAKVKQ